MGEVEDERRGGRKKGAMAAITATPTLQRSILYTVSKTMTDDFSGRRMRKCYSDSGNRYSPDEQPPAAAAKPTQNHRRRPLQKWSLSSPNRHHHLFSLKDINASILSSENARLQCSIIIALLVVMSCVSVPHGMTKSNSVIASRPLYIIILTDVTVVVARLFILRKQEHPDTVAGAHKYNEDDGSITVDKHLQCWKWGWCSTRPFVLSSLTAAFIFFLLCGLSLL